MITIEADDRRRMQDNLELDRMCPGLDAEEVS